MKNKRTSGISLVALVITIIVLIILTGAVIVTFMEGGIVDRAKEATFKSDIRTYQEILAMKKADEYVDIATGKKESSTLNASNIDDMQVIIPEINDNYNGVIAISNGEIVIGESATEQEQKWLAELGIGLAKLPENAVAKYLEVGDYVAYTPDGEIPTDLPIDLDRQDGLKWQVLNNDGRQITLISETPIDSIASSLVNADVSSFPTKLDTTYKGLYSGTLGTARNLNVNDVNQIMGYTVTTAETASGTTVEYGAKVDGNEITYYTYYGSNFKTEENEKAYSLIFDETEYMSPPGAYYLLSSTYSTIDDNFSEPYPISGVRCISSDAVHAINLVGFNWYINDSTYCARPIVILNEDVEVVSKGEGVGTASNPWEIK